MIAEPRLRTLILHHDDCLEHSPNTTTAWEGPDRVSTILNHLQDRVQFPEYELEITSQFKKASVELLGRAHSTEYIAFVDALSKRVQQEENETNALGLAVPFTPQVQKHIQHKENDRVKDHESCDTSFSSGTLRAARRAAGAVAYAVDRVLTGRNRNAFCVVRPPGHHAGYEGLFDGAKSCGFCIFNSVAAGALHALDPEGHNCPRVAIIDLDIHHGNGTEDIVKRYPHPSRLFFFSLHLYEKEHGSIAAHIYSSHGHSGGSGGNSNSSSTTGLPVSYEFFPGSGAEDDIKHNIINVPLAPIWVNEGVQHATRGAKAGGVSDQCGS
jgi:acetoin utilization deacetylase AcuC-like enzyme